MKTEPERKAAAKTEGEGGALRRRAAEGKRPHSVQYNPGLIGWFRSMQEFFALGAVAVASGADRADRICPKLMQGSV
jgi:hypothetical protein